MQNYSFSQNSRQIGRSFFDWYSKIDIPAQVAAAHALEKQARKALGTVGTTGSHPAHTPQIEKQRAAPATADQPRLHQWEKEIEARRRVNDQSRRIFEYTDKKVIHYATAGELNKAQARLDNCGRSFLVEKLPGKPYNYLNSYHCKQKFCPRCRRAKVDKWAARFSEFFETESEAVLGMLKDYDFAVLTVTLKHDRHTTRAGWYFDELKTHYRNALKYGAFNKYIKASLYSTEVTHGAKGFHIHRHAVVLIPKEYGMRDGGKAGAWKQDKAGRWKFKWKNSWVRKELRDSWHKRTGDSFEVDIRPFNSKVPMVKNLREVLKYIEFDEHGTVSPEIVEQMVTHKREKWTGRTGLFSKIKELALNSKAEKAERKEPDRDHIYIGVGIRRQGKGFGFQSLVKVPASEPDIFKTFANWQGLAEARNRNRLLYRSQTKIDRQRKEAPPDDFENPLSFPF